MARNLKLLAGPAALRDLNAHGFDPARVKVVAAAAGGAKWLVLSRLDRLLFGLLAGPRPDPLFLLGASIGAWRMTCLARRDPVGVMTRFEDDYINFDWGDERLSAAEVSRGTRRTLADIVDASSVGEILSNPTMRMNVMAVRARGPLASDRRAVLMPSLLAVVAGNLLARKSLGLFFERALFADPRDAAPFADVDELPIRHIDLSAANYADAVMATSSIPVLMEGVGNIAGAPGGVYRDGGFIDYHFDLPFHGNGAGAAGMDGIVLYPHYRERLIPGWFDKRLTWRRPALKNLDRVLLIAPSDEFSARLPGGKIPDRGDFKTYPTRKRIRLWRAVTDECQRLADELGELVESGRLVERVEPLTR